MKDTNLMTLGSSHLKFKRTRLANTEEFLRSTIQPVLRKSILMIRVRKRNLSSRQLNSNRKTAKNNFLKLRKTSARPFRKMEISIKSMKRAMLSMMNLLRLGTEINF